MDERDSDVKKNQDRVALPRLGIFTIANQLRYGLPLIVILSLLIMGWLLSELARQTQYQQLEVAQRERSRAAAGEINAYVDDLQRKLAYLARVRGLTDLSFAIQRDLLEGLIRHNDAYEAAAIVDHTGRVVMSLPIQNQIFSESLVTSPPYLKAYKQREDYIGPVEINSATGLPEITLAVPIRNWQDEVEGVLLARISLRFLWYVVSQTRVGETGYVYVLDNRNFLIAEKGSNVETFTLQDISDEPFIRNLTSGNGDPLQAYPGLKGQSVLGAIAPIRSLHWNVVVELPTSEAYASIERMLLVTGVALAIVTIAAVGLGILFSRPIVAPLQRLTEAAAQISAGNMDSQVDISSRNEVGILARTFNQMTIQLKELYETLEQQVANRTRRLELVATLNEHLTSILDLEELLIELVNQVKDKFGFYHTHVYLFDEARQNLVMTAGSGQTGEQMKASEYFIPLSAPTSLIARAARTGQVVNVDNVRKAADWLPNPLLPDTYSEMAVPIVLEGQVVGVLDVQEDKIAGLDEIDANLLRSLAGHVAVAIRNARIFGEVEAALARANEIQGRYTEQSWEKAKIMTHAGHYHYARPDAINLNAAALIKAKEKAFTHNQLTIIPINENASDLESEIQNPKSIVAPISLRNRPIGALQLHPIDYSQAWSEDDLAIVEAVVDQLAQTAENLRLFDETRERAAREQTIREIVEKMQAAPSLKRLVEIAAEELQQHLTATHVKLELGVEMERSNGAS